LHERYLAVLASETDNAWACAKNQQHRNLDRPIGKAEPVLGHPDRRAWPINFLTSSNGWTLLNDGG
jgi:hypothetical protein